MLVPELTVGDPKAAADLLGRFGFAPDGGLLRLGSQALRLVQGQGGGHGRIDHLALAVPDLAAALADLQAQGIALGEATPEGPEVIPEFWDAGLTYVYLAGPDGAKIELCQRLGQAVAAPGADHIGIPCSDLSAMQAFFLGQGAAPLAAVDLVRAEGRIPVRFLAFAGGVVELYQPPVPPTVAAPGHWSRLLVQGLPAPARGPEGLTLAPL
jgi:catechol 2,3-dioxygenase-like lactoylglutathione lyase family enzyme